MYLSQHDELWFGVFGTICKIHQYSLDKQRIVSSVAIFNKSPVCESQIGAENFKQ